MWLVLLVGSRGDGCPVLVHVFNIGFICLLYPSSFRSFADLVLLCPFRGFCLTTGHDLLDFHDDGVHY